MTETETAWLAGLLEGEGCFSSVNSGKKRNSPDNGCGIQLAMTDKDIVEKVGKLLDVHVQSKAPDIRKGRKAVWRVCIYGNKAVHTMELVLPFMGQRRSEKIKELLQKASLRMSPKEKGQRSGEVRRQAARDNRTMEMFS